MLVIYGLSVETHVKDIIKLQLVDWTEEIDVFASDYRKFCFNVMPFGLTNARIFYTITTKNLDTPFKIQLTNF